MIGRFARGNSEWVAHTVGTSREEARGANVVVVMIELFVGRQQELNEGALGNKKGARLREASVVRPRVSPGASSEFVCRLGRVHERVAEGVNRLRQLTFVSSVSARTSHWPPPWTIAACHAASGQPGRPRAQ